MISELRKRERANPNVRGWVSATPVDQIYTSVLVLGEIRRGIELKRRHDPGQAAGLEHWFATMRTGLGGRVLGVDEPIAHAWAVMSAPDPLPFIDGILAATARVHNLTLVTRNVTDMVRTGVEVLDPFTPRHGP